VRERARRGLCCFPDRIRRDQGNFRYFIEKALGDALVAGGWLEFGGLADDDWDHYEFGGMTREDLRARRVLDQADDRCPSRRRDRCAGRRDLAAGQKRSGRTKPGAESVQATRPDPTRPDPEAPQPPQAGVQWPGPPTKPTGGRQRDLAAWEQQMDAYATWLMPDIDESGRTDLVRAALGFAERCGSATNDRVRATALQLQGERVEAA
jgi:hypothetical protein